MALNFVDRYSNTLGSSYTAGGTTLAVSNATGLPTGACYFYALVKAESTNTEEVFLVTNVSALNLTVTGAQSGTSASNHSAGAAVIASIMTVGAFTQLRADQNKVGTFANLPAVGTTTYGDTYRCSDTPYSFVNNNGAWQAFYLGYPVVLPSTAGSWTWQNEGASTINTSSGSYCMSLTGTSAENVRFYGVPAVSAPCTITAAFHLSTIGGPSQTGLSVFDGTKYLNWQITLYTPSNNPLLYFEYKRYSNPSTVSVDTGYTASCAFTSIIWLRIKDDSTNRFYYGSVDGVNFYSVFSEARTAYITTPTYFGMFSNIWTGTALTQASPLVSFQITQP